MSIWVPALVSISAQWAAVAIAYRTVRSAALRSQERKPPIPPTVP
jgi:hypothetical protein